jgi:hypothetical protein
MKTTVRTGMLVFLGASLLPADFSYQQTSKITGGLMAGMMKVVGVFSKQAREPIQSTILLKGDRLATLSPYNGHIVDLGRETFTEIDFRNKTYSVITFAELAELWKRAEADMRTERGEQADVTVKASVQQTGQTKSISGLEARQVIITIEMEGTDKKTGRRGIFMTVTSDTWLARVPGYEEVTEYYRRLVQKMAFTPSGGMLGLQRSEIVKGMAELSREAAKLDGVPVYQVIKMDFKGQPGEGEQPPPAEARPPAEPPQEQPSVGGALGRLGGLGRLGRLGRKKEPAEQPRPAETAPAAEGAGSGTLMELTSESTGFSTAPVDPARLEVPAGFKRVESSALKTMKR